MNELIQTGTTIGVAFGAVLTGCAYLIYAERKIAAFIQDRVGPNRVGPLGLLQPLADGIKLLLKEDVIPGHVNKLLFLLGPSISVFATFLAFAVVPFGPTDTPPILGMLRFVIAPEIDLGMVFIFAVGSLAIYGIILGGWASNNKYSALGSLRASAQVVSYEIPLGMSIVGIALLTGSMNLEAIVNQQVAHGIWGWNLWYQPLAMVIFFTASLAEANRLPFDLTECEQELIGGFHTEYSAMKWAMFFLGEYAHVTTVSFLMALLFMGGWHFPLIATVASAYPGAWIVKLLVLLTKVLGVIGLIIVIRWTIPRFRFDQLMNLAWLIMIPLSGANVFMVMLVKEFNLPLILLLPGSLGLFLLAGLIGTQGKLSTSDSLVPLPAAGGGHGHH